jgi:hypothetical protein
MLQKHCDIGVARSNKTISRAQATRIKWLSNDSSNRQQAAGQLTTKLTTTTTTTSRGQNSNCNMKSTDPFTRKRERAEEETKFFNKERASRMLHTIIRTTEKLVADLFSPS